MTGFRKSGDRPGLRTRKQLLYLQAAACVLTALLALQALVPAAGWTVRAEAAQKTEESGQEAGADAVDLSGAPGQDEDEDAALSGSASEQTGTDSLLNLGADKQRHRIDQLMADMTLREKVGQMIHVSFRGWRDDPSGQITSFEEMNDEVRDFLSERRLGGVLLYGENCGESRKTLTLVNDMQKANAETDSKVKIPLLVSADEEGGIVSRLGQGVGWPGNMAVAATGDPEYARQEGLEIGKQLAAVSINTAFGPVMDVNDNPENPVIGVRAFSDDLLTVASCGTAFMQGMSQSGTIPVLKHFPGHGNTDSDSHTGLPRVEKTLDQLNEKELVPFRLGIEAGAEMIMTAHIEYPGLDQETYRSKATGEEVYLPATMSHTILTDILRNKMGCEGVVITDALEMASLTEHFAGSGEIVRSDKVGHLYGKPLRGRHRESAEDPGRRGDETDRGGGVGAQASDHRCVDELKQDRSQLGQDGRTAKKQGQPYLLAQRERLSVPYPSQEYILALRHSGKDTKKKRTGMLFCLTCSVLFGRGLRAEQDAGASSRGEPDGKDG